MITNFDDTLRPFSQTTKLVLEEKIPMLFLNHGQHRKEEFGKIYNAKIFKKAKEELERVCDIKIDDANFKKLLKSTMKTELKEENL